MYLIMLIKLLYIEKCRKGSLIGITGRIQTRSYDNQEGKRIYVTEVLADSVRFLEQKKHEDISEANEREAVAVE